MYKFYADDFVDFLERGNTKFSLSKTNTSNYIITLENSTALCFLVERYILEKMSDILRCHIGEDITKIIINAITQMAEDLLFTEEEVLSFFEGITFKFDE